MAKPKNKAELLEASQQNFEKLLRLIDSIEEQEREFPAGTLNRNLRDVLTHLHHWHLLFQNWYEVGMKGKKTCNAC